MLVGRSRMRSGLLANERRVPPSARLEAPIKRAWVHRHQAEARAIAVHPLEVVEERPGEVAAHGNAGLVCPRQRLDVVAQVGDALLVTDLARRGDLPR